MIWASPKRRLPLTIALLVLAVVVGTIVAHTHGPTPDRGATYTGTVAVETRAGTVIRRLPIAFAVTGAGAQTAVTALRFSGGLPSRCAGAANARVPATARAAIVSPSRFTLRAPITLGASSGARVGTLIISGVFHTLGRESGAVATSFTTAALKRCAAAGGYSTKSS